MSYPNVAFVYDISAICAGCKCDNPSGNENQGSLNGSFVGMGYKNELPWKKNSLDMKYFNEVTNFVDEKKYEGMKQKRENFLKLQGKNIKDAKTKGPLTNVVIMGRLTWDSIPPKFRPLTNRINVIMSKSLKSEDVAIPGVYVVNNVDQVLQLLEEIHYYKCFVVGGSFIYKEFLEKKLLHQIMYTRINHKYDCDTFLPLISEKEFKVISISDVYSSNGVTLDFVILQKKEESEENMGEKIGENENWSKENEKKDIPDEQMYLQILEHIKYKKVEKREQEKFPIFDMVTEKRHPEYQYLSILHDVLQNGNRQDDRTGTGVLSRFGYMMRFQLNEYFPLLTTKKLFLRGIIEELLWFIRGETNGNILLDKNVRIWEANGTREFLDKRNLFDREVNDLGPIYGFQWRHFGAEYTNMHDDYTNKGVDQLKNVIDLIKNDPKNRRIILCAWNPKDLEKMALPPCHVLCQFYIFENKLSCIMYQRSCDLGLGVPFNIASYSIFTHMIAQVCNLIPYEFIHILGNAHIYMNHVDQLKKQINRIPYPFPTLKLNPNVQNIEDFTVDDIKIENYVHHDKIVMPMAA